MPFVKVNVRTGVPRLGQGPVQPFNVFCKEKKEDPGYAKYDISDLAQEWNFLSEESKERYKRIADIRSKINRSLCRGIKSNGNSTQALKIANDEIKSLERGIQNPFFHFVKDTKSAFLSLKRDLKHPELVVEAAKVWNVLEESEKTEYYAKASADQKKNQEAKRNTRMMKIEFARKGVYVESEEEANEEDDSKDNKKDVKRKRKKKRNRRKAENDGPKRSLKSLNEEIEKLKSTSHNKETLRGAVNAIKDQRKLKLAIKKARKWKIENGRIRRFKT
eukprot:TRINITY_DN13206_c0_g1_i7.p1 TRINITY_DN13206_c0_g1~~TRINITY_DN13206_c0_g1_i7.p1  ORF type:complete len:276 (-),score=45.26 TRINITY_DN13206_c0_g1_i7:97-924(-)